MAFLPPTTQDAALLSGVRELERDYSVSDAGAETD